MTELFYAFFNLSNSTLGAGGVFVVCLSLILIVFLVCIFMVYKQKDYSIKKRVWFLVALLGICGIQRAFAILCNHSIGFSILSFSIGLILSIPIFMVEKKERSKKKEKDFIKYIDYCLHKEQPFEKEVFCNNDDKKQIRINNFEQNSKYFEEKEAPEREKGNKTYGCNLDFTHVKNVLVRLENMPLGASDKRQIKELELVMHEAKNGEYNQELKEKINDGLGALLKIMSKYGA